jgi:hypothetical protein
MHGQLGQQRSGLPHAPGTVLPHSWSYDEDALLAALVVEYGYNWHFIADTCSSTSALQVGLVGYHADGQNQRRYQLLQLALHCRHVQQHQRTAGRQEWAG